jgi:hypothetical protein
MLGVSSFVYDYIQDVSLVGYGVVAPGIRRFELLGSLFLRDYPLKMESRLGLYNRLQYKFLLPRGQGIGASHFGVTKLTRALSVKGFKPPHSSHPLELLGNKSHRLRSSFYGFPLSRFFGCK